MCIVIHTEIFISTIIQDGRDSYFPSINSVIHHSPIGASIRSHNKVHYDTKKIFSAAINDHIVHNGEGAMFWIREFVGRRRAGQNPSL